MVTLGPSIAATRKDERWSMDFMNDQLQDGRSLRVRTAVAPGDASLFDDLVVACYTPYTTRSPAGMLNAGATFTWISFACSPST